MCQIINIGETNTFPRSFIMDDSEIEKDKTEDSPLIGRKMSSSLKERIKHNTRSFSSPVSRHTLSFSPKTEENSVLYTGPEISAENIEICIDQEILQKMYLKLKRDVSVNDEKLRKLKLVEKHTLKNKPDEIERLICKWLSVTQQSLRRLYENLPENKGTFQDMLHMLNIESNTIHYDPETDTFIK